MSALKRFLCVLAAASCCGCFAVDHFQGDPARFDGLFFGPAGERPVEPPLEDDEWRVYAIFGAVAWNEEQLRFTGERLAQVGPEERPMQFVAISEMTFANGLASFGINLLLGPFGPMFFAPRSLEVQGWPRPAGN